MTPLLNRMIRNMRAHRSNTRSRAHDLELDNIVRALLSTEKRRHAAALQGRFAAIAVSGLGRASLGTDKAVG